MIELILMISAALSVLWVAFLIMIQVKFYGPLVFGVSAEKLTVPSVIIMGLLVVAMNVVHYG